MAASQAAYAAEKAIGHDGSSIIQQDVANYSGDKGDSSETMLALTWQGKNTVKVVEMPKPKILEPGDVILKVTGTTVCGSDLHLLDGTIVQLAKGDILGHEFCGVVSEVGPDVKKVSKGKRYVASFQIACGDCFFCKQKLSSQCEKTCSNTTAKAMYGNQTAGMFGYSHFTGGFAGGQAEYVRVPLGDVNLLEIPDSVPDEKALFLSDVLPTAFNAVKDTAVYEGDTVAIFGVGPIGQMAAVYAMDEGAKKIIFVDTEPRLSETKNRFSAKDQSKIELLDFKKVSFGVTNKPTVVSTLKEMTEGRGPDVALECAAGEYPKGWMHTLEIALGAETDTSEIINEMIEGVRNYGRCGVTGVYAAYTNHFNIGSLMQRGVRLIGNGQAPVHKYWDHLLQKIVDGGLDPLIMVSHRCRLEDMETVYAKFKDHEDNYQKVFVATKFSQPPAEGTPELTTY
ncbi:GroES-like protein [Microthyrium microscopicum]|uniref:GroES-like protein n=1 Tax=Microthyrium microscopicum TaxID=703497 RepID=A0A6A6UD05_9PEZI|nr:GroES-like protein [Microthyrium microscopicum]